MTQSREYIQLHDVNSTVQPVFTSGYCPISVKEEKNPPTDNYLDNITNTGIFLSEKNIHYMTYYIVSLNKTTTGQQLINLAKRIPGLMVQWSKKEDLNDFEYAHDNVLLTLSFLNKKFLVNNAYLYKGTENSNFNVFRTKDIVTDKCGNAESKKYDEMTADEYRTLDVWREEQVFTYDKLNRYQNKIPTWQKSMNIRQYDRSNDGLHSAFSDRASLNSQVRGYNMDNIHKGLEFYQVPAYEFI
jgi:hypothetical protein